MSKQSVTHTHTFVGVHVCVHIYLFTSVDAPYYVRLFVDTCIYSKLSAYSYPSTLRITTRG